MNKYEYKYINENHYVIELDTDIKYLCKSRQDAIELIKILVGNSE